MATGGRTEASGLDPELKRELGDLTAGMCRALNDPKRLMILYALSEAPRSVGALGALLDASQPNVSQHLAVLRDRGLVDSERDGARAVYSLRHPRVVEAIDILREVASDELDRRSALRIGT